MDSIPPTNIRSCIRCRLCEPGVWFGDIALPDKEQWFYHAVADVIRAYRALVAKFKGEATADVTVAENLSDKNLQALKAALKSVTGKDVTLNINVDPAIIGGLVVKLGSRMVDSSLRTKLNSIKHAMKEAG